MAIWPLFPTGFCSRFASVLQRLKFGDLCSLILFAFIRFLIEVSSLFGCVNWVRFLNGGLFVLKSKLIFVFG